MSDSLVKILGAVKRSRNRLSVFLVLAAVLFSVQVFGPLQGRPGWSALVWGLALGLLVAALVEVYAGDLGDRRARSMLSALMEGTDDYIMVADRAGRVRLFNSAYGRVMREALGLDLRPGTVVHKLLDDPEAVAYWDALHARVLGGEKFRADYSHVFPDGSKRHFEVSFHPLRQGGEVTGFTEVTRDMSDRVQAQERWLDGREKYRRLYEESKRAGEVHQSLLNSSADPIVIYDLEGLVQYINPAFTATFGWDLEELKGRRIPFMPEDEREKSIEEIRQVVDGGKRSSNFETRRLTRSGRMLNILISASRYLDHEDRPAGMLVFLKDITQMKLLEKQVMTAQKMEAVGTLAGGIAHDFNNLLQAVLGYTEIADQEEADKEVIRNSLGEIRAAAGRAAELTNQLLTFSRKQDSAQVPIDLNREIEKIEKILRRTIPRWIEIRLDLTEAPETVRADPTQVEQLLLNLAINARDAMPDGGRLAVSTRNVDLDRAFCEANLGARPGRFLLLSVADDGQGMDRETLDHIFEPFYTTKEAGRGAGLGLAMVYGIVKAHGGYITCESEPGRGAIFRVYWPAVDETPQETPPLSEEAPPRGGSETILVVDDETVIRELAAQILSDYGYRVVEASDGETALELFRERGREIDLVLLDLGMPGIGGHKCLERLKEMDPDVKVLISSGYSRTGLARGSLEKGAAGFIGKPYRLDRLLKTVRESLDSG